LSKRNVRTQSTDARTPPPPNDPAAALIAKARANGDALPPLSSEGVAALRKVCDHNDSPETSHRTRISLGTALNMLREHYGWAGHNVKTLDRLCVRVLGRQSWGVK
jgi:hypothetical protein